MNGLWFYCSLAVFSPPQMPDKRRYINAILSHLHKQDCAFGHLSPSPFLCLRIALQKQKPVCDGLSPAWGNSHFPPDSIPHFNPGSSFTGCGLWNTNQRSWRETRWERTQEGHLFFCSLLKAGEAAGDDWLWHHRQGKWFFFMLILTIHYVSL